MVIRTSAPPKKPEIPRSRLGIATDTVQPIPTSIHPSRGNAVSTEEYVTISEVAARLSVKPKTVRNKMASGVFRKGQHYVRPPGLGTRFKWRAVVAWLEQDEAGKPEEDAI